MAALLAAGAASEAFAAKTVKVGLFPFGPGRMVDDWILENGVHKKWGAKVGVDFKITHPRDDFAAFMGKSIDIVALSTLEIARLIGDEAMTSSCTESRWTLSSTCTFGAIQSTKLREI